MQQKVHYVIIPRLLISFFLLLCLCGCGGCGAYGYRRRYVVQRVQYIRPTTTTVIPPAPGKSGTSQHSLCITLWCAQYGFLSCTNAAPSAGYKPYSEHKPVTGQYQPYEPPREPPPPYNPASAPPPYGAT